MPTRISWRPTWLPPDQQRRCCRSRGFRLVRPTGRPYTPCTRGTVRTFRAGTWMIGPLPDGVPKGYLRIADGRVLRALFGIWTQPQLEAFCAPWLKLCCADRDGRAYDMALPVQPVASAVAISTPKRLDACQYQRLLDSSVPDQLLHELKGFVTPHATLASRESRHRLAMQVVESAKALGYDEPGDWMSLIAWTLREGATAEALATQDAVRGRLQGNALWDALMASASTAAGSRSTDAWPDQALAGAAG